MSYRKHKETTSSWKKWCDSNYLFLTLECGIPEDLLCSRKNWDCFLDHSFYITKGGNSPAFNFTTLSIEQTKKLYDFILKEETEIEYMQTVGELKNILKEET